MKYDIQTIENEHDFEVVLISEEVNYKHSIFIQKNFS